MGLINNNRKRFKDGVDLIDLKGTEFEILLKDNEIYKNSRVDYS